MALYLGQCQDKNSSI